MLDDTTLREVFHFRVSLLGAVSVITISIIALIVLLSVLIVYTPIRNILPGYSASLRQQLIDESARVDSLQADLRLQRQYLDVIKALTAGDIQSDSVQSLDSLQRVEKVQIVSQPNEATEAFMAQYEQKERDRLMLFSSTAPRFVRQLYRPVRGIIVASPRPDHLVTSYRHIGHVLKQQGTKVEAGESIGLMDGEHDLVVELWDAGQFVNPEEVIVW